MLVLVEQLPALTHAHFVLLLENPRMQEKVLECLNVEMGENIPLKSEKMETLMLLMAVMDLEI